LPLHPDAARWFESRRGIRPDTLESFGVASDGPDVTRFPYGDAIKYRKGWVKEERRFWWDPPTAAGQVPFLPPDFEPGAHMLLLEGETDTMAAWQAATDAWKPHIVGLSGLNAWKDRYAEELFGQAKKVFVAFDNDDPYSPAKEQGDKAWQQIRAALGRKARRVRLPQGIEDVADFFTKYDWAAFHVLLKKVDEPKRYYRRLDLSKEAPPTDWLVEDLLVRNEAAVLAGDGGVGKSMFTMQLALTVAAGRSTFLDLAVRRGGRVLYVDEENSAQLALQRLTALAADMWGKGEGIPKDVQQNLEYLWYAGVDLLNEPEKLLEEALEIEPEVIIIDSLSRVTLGAEENSNPDMTRLMKGGVIPLARDTGAAVLLVHHTDKDGRGPRGASAIRNSADQVISMVATQDKAGVKTGRINIFPSKPRRLTTHLQARIVGDIENEGWARVERVEEDDPF
jgi:KaiC/GvpD/RAD55 family RecA-like ATPase